MAPAREQRGIKAGAGLTQVTALGREQPQGAGGVGDRGGGSSTRVGAREPDETGLPQLRAGPQPSEL